MTTERKTEKDAPNLGPNLPTIHPRVEPVNRADAEIGLALSAITNKYSLTLSEVIGILAAHISRGAKYLIRHERHGDYDTPGGFA